jgi:hypothetical protein
VHRFAVGFRRGAKAPLYLRGKGKSNGKGNGKSTGKGNGNSTGKGNGKSTGKGNGNRTGKGNGNSKGNRVADRWSPGIGGCSDEIQGFLHSAALRSE